MTDAVEDSLNSPAEAGSCCFPGPVDIGSCCYCSSDAWTSCRAGEPVVGERNPHRPIR